MKLLVIDPGLERRVGHNAGIAEELDLEFGRRKDVHITYAGAAAMKPGDFADLRADFLPVFRINGYYPFALAEIADGDTFAAWEAMLAQEMASLSLSSYDLIVMPAAYPLHLRALSQCGAELRGTPLVCGLLFPARFFSREAGAEPRVQQIFGDAIERLRAEAQAFFYSETGRYATDRGLLAMPVLFTPVSRATLDAMEQLSRTLRAPADRRTVGFFGHAFARKGFGLLTAAIEKGLPAAVRVVARMPEGEENMCWSLNDRSTAIDARSARTSNLEFFGEMAKVDLVFAAYDPAYYRDQMSGIVPEAICLGKPLIVSRACTCLTEFLDRHAPGSYVSIEYDVDDLLRALDMPQEDWLRLAARATASAAAMRTHKSAARYLAIAAAGSPHAILPAAEQAPAGGALQRLFRRPGN